MSEKPASTWLAPLLHGWACQIAARFNAPVWLVGSALREAHPRDVDVVVTLSNEMFFHRYGLAGLETQMIGDVRDSIEHSRYWQDMAKLTAWADQHHGNQKLNLDFKVQDESQVTARRYDPALRVRLDTLSVPVVDAMPDARASLATEPARTEPGCTCEIACGLCVSNDCACMVHTHHRSAHSDPPSRPEER